MSNDAWVKLKKQYRAVGLKGIAASLIKDSINRFKESKNKTRAVLVIIFVALLVFGLFTLVGMYITKGDVPGFLEVSGRIEGYEYHAGTKVAGKVIEMYVEEGQEVGKGQPIGRILSRQREAALKEAKAKLKLAEIEFDHYKRLLEKKATAKIKYDRARKERDVALGQVASAEADMEDTNIVAPISGVVVIKIVRVGEVVAVGTPLVTMINLDDLYFKIFLATDVAGKINLGNEAKVMPDALPREIFDAYVNKISPKAEFTPKNVETKSQRAKLVFQMKLKIKENKGLKLKPGMPCSGVIKYHDKASWKSY